MALSTSCRLPAAVCVMKNVTTIGGGSAGIEVRSRLGPSLLTASNPFSFLFVLYDNSNVKTFLHI